MVVKHLLSRKNFFPVMVSNRYIFAQESRGIIPPEVVPKVGLQGNGEGLVWEAGESALALAVTEFGWRSARRIRFLEVQPRTWGQDGSGGMGVCCLYFLSTTLIAVVVA